MRRRQVDAKNFAAYFKPINKKNSASPCNKTHLIIWNSAVYRTVTTYMMCFICCMQVNSLCHWKGADHEQNY